MRLELNFYKSTGEWYTTEIIEMKEIQHNKFSLFLLERSVRGEKHLLEECCIHLDEYDTLEEAKLAQTQYDLKTIIIPTY
jgi:hypothetical protein